MAASKNNTFFIAFVGLITSTVVGFCGWVFAGVNDHETRLAVEEQRSVENDKHHSQTVEQLKEINRKLDHILEGSHDRNPRPTR